MDERDRIRGLGAREDQGRPVGDEAARTPGERAGGAAEVDRSRGSAGREAARAGELDVARPGAERPEEVVEGQVDHAAGERQAARAAGGGDAAGQGRRGAQPQRTGRDRRAARIGIRAGEHERAGAGLGDAIAVALVADGVVEEDAGAAAGHARVDRERAGTAHEGGRAVEDQIAVGVRGRGVEGRVAADADGVAEGVVATRARPHLATGERERAGADDARGDGAGSGRGADGNGQTASGQDGRAAGVGVAATAQVDVGRPGAGDRERAWASDQAVDLEPVRPVTQRAAAGPDAHALVGRERHGRGVGERAAVDHDVAGRGGGRRAAERGIARDHDGAAGNRRGAEVGVGAGERERAGAGLRDAAGSGEHARVGGGGVVAAHADRDPGGRRGVVLQGERHGPGQAADRERVACHRLVEDKARAGRGRQRRVLEGQGVGQGEGAGGERSGAGEGVGGGEDERARAPLREAQRVGPAIGVRERCGEGERAARVGRVEGERRAAEEAARRGAEAGDRADVGRGELTRAADVEGGRGAGGDGEVGGRPVGRDVVRKRNLLAELERAGRNGRRAAVGVGASEHERAVADLRQRAGVAAVADAAADGQRVGEHGHCAIARQRDGTRAEVKRLRADELEVARPGLGVVGREGEAGDRAVEVAAGECE